MSADANLSEVRQAKASWKATVSLISGVLPLVVGHFALELAYRQYQRPTDLTEPNGMPLWLISGFLLILPFAVIAVVFGHLSRSEIKRSAWVLTGSGRALAGLILGYLVGGSIVIVIAAIGIPNLLRNPLPENQAFAVSSLRTVATAEVTYSSTYNGCYSRTLSELGPPGPGFQLSEANAGLVDKTLASGASSGYLITYKVTRANRKGCVTGFAVWADPVRPGTTGQDHYYTDESGVVRFEANTVSRNDSPPIGSQQ